MAVPLAMLQAIAQATLLSRGELIVLPDWGFSSGNYLSSITIIIGMTAGTMFAIWLGQFQRRGQLTSVVASALAEVQGT